MLDWEDHVYYLIISNLRYAQFAYLGDGAPEHDLEEAPESQTLPLAGLFSWTFWSKWQCAPRFPGPSSVRFKLHMHGLRQSVVHRECVTKGLGRSIQAPDVARCDRLVRLRRASYVQAILPPYCK